MRMNIDDTPLKFNIDHKSTNITYIVLKLTVKYAPENQWLEDEISFWDTLFSGIFRGNVSFLKGTMNQFLRLPVCRFETEKT